MYLSRASADFLKFYNRARNDIFAFCRGFNFEPTAQQVPVLSAIQSQVYYGKPTHMAIKSGQGPGKTTLATIAGLWKAFRHFMALTVVTAPTMRQCKEVWLAEARGRVMKAHPEIRKFFEVRATEIEILGVEDWGIKLASASKPENMQGWHNDHLSFIVDEASGVARNIIETILGTLSNTDKMLLMIGNPNTRDSSFFDCFNRDRRKWWTLTLNAEESPIVDKENVRRLADLYGTDSDVYRVRVLGEFPQSDPNCVMSSDDLEACARTDKMDMVRRSSTKQFGMDFARYGDDASVAYRRSGHAVVGQRIHYKAEPDKIIAQVFADQGSFGWENRDCWYVVDAGGVGQGLLHHFHNNRKQTHEFHFGGKPTSSEYHDKVTEAFFSMAKYVRQRDCHIPNDPQLIEELSSRQYAMTLKGKIKVESKEEYRKRVQAGSPDHADAMVMTFYDMLAMQGRVAG